MSVRIHTCTCDSPVSVQKGSLVEGREGDVYDVCREGTKIQRNRCPDEERLPYLGSLITVKTVQKILRHPDEV